MKRVRRRREAEDRRDARRRTLRSIEDKELDDDLRHLDDDLSDWPEDEGIAEEIDDDGLP